MNNISFIEDARNVFPGLIIEIKEENQQQQQIRINYLICEYCNAPFGDKKELKKHKKDTHSIKVQSIMSNQKR